MTFSWEKERFRKIKDIQKKEQFKGNLEKFSPAEALFKSIF